MSTREETEEMTVMEDHAVTSNNNNNTDTDVLGDEDTFDQNPLVILINQFLSFTGTTDKEVARQYLETSGNRLEDAVNLFWIAAVNNDDHEYADVASSRRRDNGDSDNGESVMIMDGRSAVEMDGSMNEYLSEEFDYGNLLDDDDVVEENRVEDQKDDNDEDDDLRRVDSSPNYEYLNLDSVYEEGIEDSDHTQVETTARLNHDSDVTLGDADATNNDPNGIYPTKGHKVDIQPMPADDDDDDDDDEVEDIGEEYILGTMMVRVLQARHVKSNPYNEGGGLIANLLSNHRRNRYQRTTPSPASAGGGYGTPTTSYSGNNQQIYATLSYRNQSQFTSMAMEHNGNGDYYWSRSDQSYFDVMCPAFPLKMNSANYPKSPSKKTGHPQKTASLEKPNTYQYHPRKPLIHSPSPLLELSLYSKKNSSQGSHNKQGKWNPYQKEGVEIFPETNDDYLVGKCYINVLRILCGKTPYFDEWCTIHSDHNHASNNKNKHRDKNRDTSDSMAGRVRIVIEYEPTDPPPRPGDLCVFANVYPIVDELYPIPPFSIVRSSIHRWSSSTSSSSSSSSLRPSTKTVSCRPKTFCVEEVVGDHVVLSYHTPVENWKCTFEVHRYLLLCVERHQAAVEKYREQVLDLCDNLVQSPVVDVLTKTVSTLPDEGLVYVGAELVIGSLGLLGRWWENGVDGMIEDVVDGINLDGRHSHFLDDDGEEEGNDGVANEDTQEVQNPLMVMKNLTEKVGNDERTALPGMPCCPITGVPMIEPVVAADGHTYERHAIARWLQTSSRSPLTGEILAHRELVPNYLLLSSLGNEMKKTNDNENLVPGMLDVL